MAFSRKYHLFYFLDRVFFFFFMFARILYNCNNNSIFFGKCLFISVFWKIICNFSSTFLFYFFNISFWFFTKSCIDLTYCLLKFVLWNFLDIFIHLAILIYFFIIHNITMYMLYKNIDIFFCIFLIQFKNIIVVMFCIKYKIVSIY